MNRDPLLTLTPFVATPAHECSYLEDKDATLLFVDPELVPDKNLYTSLIRYGFRRSAEYLYRPACTTCSACRSIRIDQNTFTPNRSQRRCLTKNEDIVVTKKAAEFDEQHFLLYQRYMSAQHADSGMETDSRETYLSFLSSKWLDTHFYEFKLGDQVIALSAVDQLNDSLSAVYTFYDPELPDRSLGVFSVLRLIDEVRSLGLQYLYLGYWIPECKKMAYKSNYRPFEALIDGQWIPSSEI